MKIRSVEAELFRADTRMDRQTGMTKLIVAFQNFLTRLKVEFFSSIPINKFQKAINNPQ